HQRIRYDSELPSLLKIPRVQCRTDITAIAARAHAPQKSQAPLGLVSAIGPTGSHVPILRLLSRRAAAPLHIPRTSSRQTCDTVRSLALRVVLAHRPAASR